MLAKPGLKIFLTVESVFVFILGGICLGIGVWMAVDKIFVSDIIGTNLFSAASYMVILCGVVLLVISFLGVYGTMTEGKKVLLIYAGVTLLTVILLILAGILAAAFRGELESTMTNAMKTSLINNYGYNIYSNAENKRITDSWDMTQKQLRCCAVDDYGYGLYRDSNWYKTEFAHLIEKDSKKYIPETCCKFIENLKRYQNVKQCQSNQYGPPGELDTARAQNDAMYMTGCYVAAKTFVEEYSGILIAIGFCFGILLISGVVFAVLLYRRLVREFIPVRTHEEAMHMG